MLAIATGCSADCQRGECDLATGRLLNYLPDYGEVAQLDQARTTPGPDPARPDDVRKRAVAQGYFLNP